MTDQETYDLIFEEAVKLAGNNKKPLAHLLMQIVTEWDNNHRSVPLTVISAAVSLAEQARALRESSQGKGAFSVEFLEPTNGS